MRRDLVILIVLTGLTGCDGYYKVSGTVYETESGIKKSLDSTIVKVYCCNYWLRGTTITDSTGQYILQGLTTPQKATYYIVFERITYKTDTVKVQGSRGKTIIELDKEMSKTRMPQ